MQGLKSLLVSRKFWLTVISVAGSVALYFRHAITAEQLANVFTAAGGVLVIAIAHEDNGTNAAPVVSAVGGLGPDRSRHSGHQAGGAP